MEQTEPIENIVAWMNERPEKLFDGKYNKFDESLIGKSILGVYKLKAYPDELQAHKYTFHDTRLLRELAKAKWGDGTHAFVDDSLFCQECGACLYDQSERCFELSVEEWVLIEDEAKLIETIANDILS